MKNLNKCIIIFMFLPVPALAQSLDSNVFKYFPLNMGNRWTWYRVRYISPGPGFETLKITGTFNANNHKYYSSIFEVFYGIVLLLYSTRPNYRIDSLSGNLYNYD